MHVLILGGTGTIGTAVTQELRRCGHQVTGLSRSRAADRTLRSLGAEPLRGDLRQPGLWARQVQSADAVIQLAATFDAGMAAADSLAVEAILRQAALRTEPLRLLYTGGCWLYGATGQRVADESSPLHPIRPFAWMCENAARILDAPGVSAAVIHPGMVYHQGGGAFAGFLAAARAQQPFEIWGSIRTRWPLVQRDDLARAYRLLLDRPDLTGHFNASAETGVPVAAVTAEIARRHRHPGDYVVRSLKHVLNAHGDWAEGPTLDQQMASDKLRSLTGWQPETADFRTAAF